MFSKIEFQLSPMNWVTGKNSSKMEVQLNDLQNKFIQFVLEGHSTLLSGDAGTGKSTALAVAGLTLKNNGKKCAVSVINRHC